MRPELLVLGRNGQLATSVRRHDLASQFSITCAGRAECDIRDTTHLLEYLRAINPTAVLNTAAFTDVEAAEQNQWEALKLNANAVQVVAQHCAEAKIPLVHISTDYVYDGEKGAPYTEADALNPLTSYGCSKALGDLSVLNYGGVILRTAWLFSGHNRNFVTTMMNLASKNEVVRVVDDQHGNPTCADDLAGLALQLISRIIDGEVMPNLFLAAGESTASWADLAEATFQAMEAAGRKRPVLERITSAEFPTKARRPKDTRFNTSLLRSKFPDALFDWRKSVVLAVKAGLDIAALG